MRVSYRWLSRLVIDLPAVEEVAARLTMGGLEVEAIEQPVVQYGDRLVIARIVEMGPHPSADRLSLCQVDDGEGRAAIVCGARNMKAGDTVVLARPGCELPGGTRIKVAKLRGVESRGMLCSAAELGLPTAGEGILILEQGLMAGAPAAPMLGLDDSVMEVAVTPNRGDCLSMRGIAREVAALCGCGLAPEFALPSPSWNSRRHRPPVRIEAGAACSHYRGIVVRGVSVGASPTWLRTRLSAAGLRPISNVVDVTNYVLLEAGQPLHAFDLALLGGPELTVRYARAGERLRTLDDRDVELDAGDLVIADAKGPVALAGVMGGADTAVNDRSCDIFLEGAAFTPADVRRSSRRLGILSDSSARFERGIDTGAVEAALWRAARLIVEVAGGRIEEGFCGDGVAPGTGAPILLRSARIERILGTAVAAQQTQRILVSLGATVAPHPSGVEVTVPNHRNDLTREIDLIEEVARVRGYDSFRSELPAVQMHPVSLSACDRAARDLRGLLASRGFYEHVGLAFASAETNARLRGLHRDESDCVRVRNPLRADENELRRSALHSLLEAYRLNVAVGETRVDLFCLGRTFAWDGPGAPCAADATNAAAIAQGRNGRAVRQIETLSGLLAGARPGRGVGRSERPAFGDAKAVVEAAVALLAPYGRFSFVPCAERREYHPLACARVLAGDEPVGYLGRLHPVMAEELEITEEIYLFEVDWRRVVEYSPRHEGLRPIPRYPSSSRDVSLLVPRRLAASAVIEVVERLADPCIESVSVFDEYTGAGIDEADKALGYTIVYRAGDRTLTEAEVTELHERVVGELAEQLRARVRA